MRVIRVLVSSPSDQVKEHACVRQAAARFNDRWSAFMGVQYEVFSYPDSAYSATAASAQKVVWDQLQPYEIYIGLLWSRLGTPTANWRSGTEEEFRISLRRLREGTVRLLSVYVCQRRIAPTTDAAQLGSLQAFLSEIEGDGVLPMRWKTKQELEDKVALSLCRFAQRMPVQHHPRPLDIGYVNSLVDLSGAATLGSTEILNRVLSLSSESRVASVLYRELKEFTRLMTDLSSTEDCRLGNDSIKQLTTNFGVRLLRCTTQLVKLTDLGETNLKKDRHTLYTVAEAVSTVLELRAGDPVQEVMVEKAKAGGRKMFKQIVSMLVSGEEFYQHHVLQAKDLDAQCTGEIEPVSDALKRLRGLDVEQRRLCHEAREIYQDILGTKYVSSS